MPYNNRVLVLKIKRIVEKDSMGSEEE